VERGLFRSAEKDAYFRKACTGTRLLSTTRISHSATTPQRLRNDGEEVRGLGHFHSAEKDAYFRKACTGARLLSTTRLSHSDRPSQRANNRIRLHPFAFTRRFPFSLAVVSCPTCSPSPRTSSSQLCRTAASVVSHPPCFLGVAHVKSMCVGV